MNDLMSAGIHRIWKDAMVEWLNPQPGWRCLDVAGGTGDIAFRIADMARSRGRAASQDIEVTVCDINAAMLGEGMRRARAKGEGAIEWVCGNAESLPFPDACFDAYTIAFGIRNVTHIDAALRQARRVLKPGGRFLCLEFSKLEVPVLDKLYDAYSFKLLPRIGAVVAKDEDSYRYLAESIRRFPPQAKFAAMIEQAGLSQVKVRNLSGGIAAMHSAWRL
jgi:demethylmenaquinone methyltransferase/2-methoxy-6-polyprenyl-1,4-benzoquinol methylase